MKARSMFPYYSVGEEIANSLTHGIGVVLSVAGLAVLTGFASAFGTVWHIVSCSIYGVTQILLYTASTLYHGIPLPRAKAVLRVLDHAAIFLLIAGTYTPFALISLGGAMGWTILGVVWGLAITGIAFQTILIRHKAILTILPYIAMGWLAVFAVKPMVESIAPGGLILLTAGGLCYTLGCVFYVWRRLPYHHAVWHIFVMGGSAMHFFAVLFYVIPIPG
jgi:hemolysin III